MTPVKRFWPFKGDYNILKNIFKDRLRGGKNHGYDVD
jgi:hypothetical protein